MAEMATDDTILLTSEVLADAVRLTHPDAHPPERRELANRVTEQLLALKPFVFPALKPKPPPIIDGERNGSSNTDAHIERAVTPPERYPCVECALTIPLHYCTACRVEWEKRYEVEVQQERAKHRKWYAERKARLAKWKRQASCASCGKAIEGKRRDARYCSNACRQRAHRKTASTTTPEAETAHG
jgi:hypothetical protein